MTSNPFPGLRPFQTGEEHLFFGREGLSEEILRRLRQNRFLAVLGTSGSGKSSLIRAGLLPYLHGGFMAGASSHWLVAIFRPESDPIGNLARALDVPGLIGTPAPTKEDATRNALEIEASLRRSGIGLIEAVNLAHLPAHENVLIVVDQFEELFRFANAAGPAQRQEDASAFVKLLMEATQQKETPIYVVITMRSDFIGECARYRDLPEAVTTGLYLVPRMAREQRRAAIEQPVRVADSNSTISPRLVNRLLSDAGDDPQQLPILQHALMRTWDHWFQNRTNGNAIDVDDYVNVGCISDALSQHADQAYGELPDDHHRLLAKKVFQALTEKGADNREIRRPTTVVKIAAAAQASVPEVITVIEHFRQPGRSFLTTPAEALPDANSVIDISHESLIRGWAKLRAWVEEESRSASEYRRLAQTAERHAVGKADLLREPELSVAVKWRNETNPHAAWAERYHSGFTQAMAFLEESEKDRDTEMALSQLRRNKERRTRIYLRLAAPALVITAGLIISGIYLNYRDRIQREKIDELTLAKKTQDAQTGEKLAQVEAQEAKDDKARSDAFARDQKRLLRDLQIAKNQEDRANKAVLNTALEYNRSTVAAFEELPPGIMKLPQVQSLYEKVLNSVTRVHSKMLEHDPSNQRAMILNFLNRLTLRSLHLSQGAVAKTKQDCVEGAAEAEILASDKNYFSRTVGAALMASISETRTRLNDEDGATRDAERAATIADTVSPRLANDSLSQQLLIYAYSTAGNTLKKCGRFADARKDYRKAGELYQAKLDAYKLLLRGELSDEEVRSVTAVYGELASLQNEAGDLTGARENSDQQIKLLRPLATRPQATAADKKLLASAYGNRSWYDVLFGDFEGAISDAQNGLSWDNKQVWILTNEAHGYLFMGKIDIACKIYLENADKLEFPDSTDSSNSKKTFREGVLEDFEKFRAHPVRGMDLTALNTVEPLLKNGSSAGTQRPVSQTPDVPKR